MNTKIKVYILQEPRHISCSIIYLSENFYKEFSSKDYNDVTAAQINQIKSDTLDKLSKYTDLFFIFSKELTKKISPEKFSTLYDSLGYAISETDNISESILNSFDYLNEVFKKHLSYFYIDDIVATQSNINIDTDLINIQKANINKCIFEITRVNQIELEEIYKKPEKSWWENLFDKEDNSGKYCTHKTNSAIYFIPANITKKIIKYCDENKDYLKTFNRYSFYTFIASVIVKLGVDENLMNYHLENVLNHD